MSLQSALAHIEKAAATNDWCELKPTECKAIMFELRRARELLIVHNGILGERLEAIAALRSELITRTMAFLSGNEVAKEFVP